MTVHTSALRVLLVSQPTTGGAARCVQQLAAAGVEAGLRITVASPDEGDLPGWVAEAGADHAVVPLVRAPGPHDLARLAQLRALARGADVVHLHSSKAGALGRLALLGRYGGPPVVFSPHGWSWQAEGRLPPAYRCVERVLGRRASAILAVSEEEAVAGRAVLGRTAAKRVEVIENGVDTERFLPTGPAAPRSADPLVVVVGRLAWPKGQEVALAALAALAAPAARLRLVGDGPDRQGLEALAARLGVAERVEWTGTVADPAPHLRAADVVVIPSHSEGLSLTMLEAMACARPVVSTAVSGSGALEGVGVVVPTADPARLAAAVDILLADPSHRADLGAAARRRAVERFRLADACERTLALWHRAAGRRWTSDRVGAAA